MRHRLLMLDWCLWQDTLIREMEPNASSSNRHRFIYNTLNTLFCIILKTNATIYTQDYLFSPLAFIYSISFFTLFFKLCCSLLMLEHFIGSCPKNIPPHISVTSQLFIHMGQIKLKAYMDVSEVWNSVDLFFEVL